jgi:hypothetical protein
MGQILANTETNKQEVNAEWPAKNNMWKTLNNKNIPKTRIRKASSFRVGSIRLKKKKSLYSSTYCQNRLGFRKNSRMEKTIKQETEIHLYRVEESCAHKFLNTTQPLPFRFWWAGWDSLQLPINQEGRPIFLFTTQKTKQNLCFPEKTGESGFGLLLSCAVSQKQQRACSELMAPKTDKPIKNIWSWWEFPFCFTGGISSKRKTA